MEEIKKVKFLGEVYDVDYLKLLDLYGRVKRGEEKEVPDKLLVFLELLINAINNN